MQPLQIERQSGPRGLYELMEVNNRLRTMILTGTEFEIREAGRGAGLGP